MVKKSSSKAEQLTALSKETGPSLEFIPKRKIKQKEGQVIATKKQRMAVFAVAQATGKLLTKPEYLNKYLTKYLILVKEYSKKNSSNIRWFDPGFLVCTQDDFERAWERLEQVEEHYWDEKLAQEDLLWK